jgi:[ribosomal protein S5]-alanine N-acetyltransferase
LPQDQSTMNNFPEIITDRLRLRKIRHDDISSLIKYCNNEAIADQIINIPYPYEESDAIYRMNFILQGFKNKERYVFAITLKDNDELIGEIGLHLDKTNDSAQFGYWIGEPFWGKGIATEATAAILKFGFETLNLNKIYATHYPDNKASGKVMLKNKMIKEAELKAHYKIKDSYRDVIQYRLTNKEYKDLNTNT